MSSFKKCVRDEVVGDGAPWTVQIAALLALGGYIVWVLDGWYRGRRSGIQGFGGSENLFPVL